MKRSGIFRIGLFAFSFAFAVSAHAQRIKGSDTVLPVSQQAAEDFMKVRPKAHVTVTGGGTGVGISSLMDGTCDIAMASRGISFGERMKFKKAGKDIREAIIAYDALAVVVNPFNPVSSLTREQLEGIFRGKITNWKDVGGNDMKIVVYSRETSSGTYEFFKESVLEYRNYMAGTLSMPATGAVIQSVSQTKGAIGYVGLAYLSPRVKAIAVSYDKGKTYVYPTVENASAGLYPIVRPLYYYYDSAREETVRPFVDYLLSTAGQAVVRKDGYVPLN